MKAATEHGARAKVEAALSDFERAALDVYARFGLPSELGLYWRDPPGLGDWQRLTDANRPRVDCGALKPGDLGVEWRELEDFVQRDDLDSEQGFARFVLVGVRKARASFAADDMWNAALALMVTARAADAARVEFAWGRWIAPTHGQPEARVRGGLDRAESLAPEIARRRNAWRAIDATLDQSLTKSDRAKIIARRVEPELARAPRTIRAALK